MLTTNTFMGEWSIYLAERRIAMLGRSAYASPYSGVSWGPGSCLTMSRFPTKSREVVEF